MFTLSQEIEYSDIIGKVTFVLLMMMMMMMIVLECKQKHFHPNNVHTKFVLQILLWGI